MGGPVHDRLAYGLASAGVKARPTGDLAVGLDTGAPHLTIIMSGVLVVNERGAQHQRRCSGGQA